MPSSLPRSTPADQRVDGQTLRTEVIFLETPHRMDITCSLPVRTAEAVWRHPPLTPSKLQHLHCPR